MFISASSGEKIITINFQQEFRKTLSLGLLAFCFTWLFITYKRYTGELLWKNAYLMTRNGQHNEAHKNYNELKNVMAYNPFFAFNYGAEFALMGFYQESIIMLKSIKPRYYDIDYNIYLGISYEGLGEYNQAVFCFEQAACMMPSKFLPKYKLVSLYEITGLENKAINMANEILKMPIKVESDFVNEVKEIMQVFLTEKLTNES
jgi:tetratricopeptide (TPR) repeat protein